MSVSAILIPAANTSRGEKIDFAPPGVVAHVPKTIDPLASLSPVSDKSTARDDTLQLTEALAPGIHDAPNVGSVTIHSSEGVGTSRIVKVPAGVRVRRAGHCTGVNSR